MSSFTHNNTMPPPTTTATTTNTTAPSTTTLQATTTKTSPTGAPLDPTTPPPLTSHDAQHAPPTHHHHHGTKIGEGVRKGVGLIHGSGEALRGNINAAVDTATGDRASAARNERIAEKGVREMEGGLDGGRRR